MHIPFSFYFMLKRAFQLLFLCGWVVVCAPLPIEAPTRTPLSTSTPAPRRYPLPPRMQSPEYGIQAFVWWTIGNKTASNDLGLVRDMGFDWLKHKFGWRDIELHRGEFDWTRTDAIVAAMPEYNLKLLARLDAHPFWSRVDKVDNGPPDNFQDYANFCSALATRYKGRIAAYEVWNEPNLARDWGSQPPDPAAYVELLKACYLAIKAADPHAIVISAGLAPTGTDDPAVSMPDEQFYIEMYEAGAAPYFDMLGVHAPGYMNPPELSPAETEADPNLQARWITFRHVENIRAIMERYGDGEKQIAITEMGWTTDRVNVTYSWFAVTEEQQADYLVRAYKYAKENWSPWIGLMNMIYIADPFWTEQHEQYWWSITRPVPAGDPPVLLPAYEALQEMEK